MIFFFFFFFKFYTYYSFHVSNGRLVIRKFTRWEHSSKPFTPSTDAHRTFNLITFFFLLSDTSKLLIALPNKIIRVPQLPFSTFWKQKHTKTELFLLHVLVSLHSAQEPPHNISCCESTSQVGNVPL